MENDFKIGNEEIRRIFLGGAYVHRIYYGNKQIYQDLNTYIKSYNYRVSIHDQGNSYAYGPHPYSRRINGLINPEDAPVVKVDGNWQFDFNSNNSTAQEISSSGANIFWLSNSDNVRTSSSTMPTQTSNYIAWISGFIPVDVPYIGRTGVAMVADIYKIVQHTEGKAIEYIKAPLGIYPDNGEQGDYWYRRIIEQ